MIYFNYLGTEIILKPNACYFGEGEHWRLRSKSIENIVGIIMSNYANTNQNGYKMNGQSCAYNWNGDQLGLANGTQQLMIVDFNITDIRQAKLNYYKPAFKMPRLCELRRQNDFTEDDYYHRRAGSTI